MKLSTILFLITSFTAHAQTKHTLSGYIKDASNGEALIGATVFVKETSGGGVTNVYGFYSITIPASTYSLEVSYIGYEKIVQQILLEKFP